MVAAAALMLAAAAVAAAVAAASPATDAAPVGHLSGWADWPAWDAGMHTCWAMQI